MLMKIKAERVERAGRTVATYFLAGLLLAGSAARADDKGQPAFKINGKVTTLDELYKQDQASFYDLDKKRYDLVERLAKEQYIEYFWQQRAKETGKSVAESKKAYEDKNLKVSERELQETL